MGVGVEETAVDVGEVRQVRGLFRRVGLVKGREEISDEVGGVGAVVKRVRTHRIGELILGEDARVLREVAEQQAREEDVEAVAVGRVVEEPGVGGGELVKKLAHLLRRLDVGMRLRGVLGLLHASPGEEESEVLVDLTQREGTVLRSLRVVGDGVFAVRDDDEARAELHHRGRNAQLFELVQEVALGLAEVDDVLLRHLPLRVVGHVEGTVAQAGYVAFRPAVGEEEIEDDLAVIVLAPSEGLDAFFNRLEVQSCHVRFPFSCQRRRRA